MFWEFVCITLDLICRGCDIEVSLGTKKHFQKTLPPSMWDSLFPSWEDVCIIIQNSLDNEWFVLGQKYLKYWEKRLYLS